MAYQQKLHECHQLIVLKHKNFYTSEMLLMTGNIILHMDSNLNYNLIAITYSKLSV